MNYLLNVVIKNSFKKDRMKNLKRKTIIMFFRKVSHRNLLRKTKEKSKNLLQITIAVTRRKLLQIKAIKATLL